MLISFSKFIKEKLFITLAYNHYIVFRNLNISERRRGKPYIKIPNRLNLILARQQPFLRLFHSNYFTYLLDFLATSLHIRKFKS